MGFITRYEVSIGHLSGRLLSSLMRRKRGLHGRLTANSSLLASPCGESNGRQTDAVMLRNAPCTCPHTLPFSPNRSERSLPCLDALYTTQFACVARVGIAPRTHATLGTVRGRGPKRHQALAEARRERLCDSWPERRGSGRSPVTPLGGVSRSETVLEQYPERIASKHDFQSTQDEL